MYTVNIEAINDIVSVNVPENVSGDVAGNKNLASNVLQVSHCKDFLFFLVVISIGNCIVCEFEGFSSKGVDVCLFLFPVI